MLKFSILKENNVVRMELFDQLDHVNYIMEGTITDYKYKM